MNVQAMLAFAFLAAGAATKASEGVFDSILMQLAANSSSTSTCPSGYTDISGVCMSSVPRWAGTFGGDCAGMRAECDSAGGHVATRPDVAAWLRANPNYDFSTVGRDASGNPKMSDYAITYDVMDDQTYAFTGHLVWNYNEWLTDSATNCGLPGSGVSKQFMSYSEITCGWTYWDLTSNRQSQDLGREGESCESTSYPRWFVCSMSTPTLTAEGQVCVDRSTMCGALSRYCGAYHCAASCGTCTPVEAAPASATGDPHLQNIHGERFDLMQPGVHVLLQIPRRAAIDNTLLTVQAVASRLGGKCEDIYFQTVNVTGAWADKAQAGEVRYDTNSGGEEKPKWTNFGPVALKVGLGRTEQGTKYLNIFVKHLGRVGFAVGGLLGEDDHEDVSAPPAWCTRRLALQKARSHSSSRGSSAASTAEGALA